MSAPVRFGRYRVDRRIGSGSFATVWLAHDEVLDAPVAVKVLADNWAHHLDVRERFLEEARILRRADSDRVVRVHDLGELDDGRPYFVMTYADRGTLAERLRAGPLPIPLALQYGADVARGLAVLHAVGVIHRDVNPGNVLLRSGRERAGERVLVADLGLAKAAAHGSGFTLTVGTPGYMAPEQASPGSGLDRRADVYSVGVLVHHLLTGVAPDPDRPPAPPRSIRPEVPAEVDAVVRQALARRPEDRFPSAGALADALDAAAVGLRAGPPAPSELAPRPDPPAAAGARPGRPKPPSDRGMDDRGMDDRGMDDRGMDDTVQLPRRPRPSRGRRVLLVALVVLLLAGGSVAAVVLRDRATAVVDVTGAGGRLAVTVPAAWARQTQDDAWDLGPYGRAGQSGAGLVVASDVASWRDPRSSTPGVFVGRGDGSLDEDVVLARSAAARSCSAGTRRPWRNGDLSGTATRRECPTGVAFVEAVLRPAGAAYTVYVQVKEPAGGGDADRVLDSVRVS